jgi:hypothetical protein
VNRPVVIAAVMLVIGAATGWIARGRYDGGAGKGVHAADDDAETDATAGTQAAPAAAAARSHDDELREILADPKARALAAKVRNASRVGDECEVEVDTAIGWFRAACGTGETPSVGDKLEVFGRVSPTGQIDGVPPLLRPSWLEPPGTIARLRGP